ncbi:MAG: hypothetical protein R3B89_18240 [Polyangiaceae bacterium]
MLRVALLLGLVWALKPARRVSEIVLGLVPVAVFLVASYGSELLLEDWAALGVALAGQVLACCLIFPIGHWVRARRMREVIEAA